MLAEWLQVHSMWSSGARVESMHEAKLAWVELTTIWLKKEIAIARNNE